MKRVSSNASDSTDSCITVAPSRNNDSVPGLSKPLPKQRSQTKPKIAAPKRSTSTRRSSRFVEEDVDGATSTASKQTGSRTVSESTLVESVGTSKTNLVENGIQSLDLEWTVDAMPGDALKKLATTKTTKKTRGTRLNEAAKSAANAVASAASVLGKRGRDALESGKDTIEKLATTTRSSRRPKITSTPSDEVLEPASKRTKLDESSKYRDPAPWEFDDRNKQRKVKRHLNKGLYAGQNRYFDARFSEAKNKKRGASKVGAAPVPENKTMPLPMFSGERLLENGRDFKLPFFVCNPLMTGPPKADEWKKIKKNRFVGDAADHWRKHVPLAPSLCMCTPEEGCGSNCHNVMMYYECDETNCNVGPEHCQNRHFADLKRRVARGGRFDSGVDVMKTPDRGYGVRANRNFRPNQIIMEYAGEIITQEESDRRMREEYKDNKCYYLMEFQQGMIIDATRGSMARFVNHSCEPNCRMEQWNVNGEPRMALFAGDDGILVGEELTYDYNFNNFNASNVQECRCGALSCRGVLGPKTRETAKSKKDATNGASAAANAVKRKPEPLESEPPAKKTKTLKEAAKSALSTVANALQSSNDEPTKLQKRVDKENDDRAARLERRRVGSSTTPATSSSSPPSKTASATILARSERPSRRHTLASTATRSKNLVEKTASQLKASTTTKSRTSKRTTVTKKIGTLDLTNVSPSKQLITEIDDAIVYENSKSSGKKSKGKEKQTESPAPVGLLTPESSSQADDSASAAAPPAELPLLPLMLHPKDMEWILEVINKVKPVEEVADAQVDKQQRAEKDSGRRKVRIVDMNGEEVDRLEGKKVGDASLVSLDGLLPHPEDRAWIEETINNATQKAKSRRALMDEQQRAVKKSVGKGGETEEAVELLEKNEEVEQGKKAENAENAFQRMMGARKGKGKGVGKKAKGQTDIREWA
ncbi:MAG: hypothetical protein M1820_006650 [Bogoriella megaspora]|nr:MAG: hypothetical protein M1820_006650 [Bogoriella megaspora]